MSKRPNVPQNELDKLQDQFDDFKNNVETLTQDRMNEAPKLEVEPQTRMSSKELNVSNARYLKPFRSISSKEKFNEHYRKQYEEDKEIVEFIAENREIIGEEIDIWTKPFAGMSAEWWKVPVNKLVAGPKYLRDQIQSCSYHRLSMQNAPTNSDGMGQYYGTMVVDNVVNRLDAYTPNKRRQLSFAGN